MTIRRGYKKTACLELLVKAAQVKLQRFEDSQRTRRSHVVRVMVWRAVQWLTWMCRPGRVPIVNWYAGTTFIHRLPRWFQADGGRCCPGLYQEKLTRCCPGLYQDKLTTTQVNAASAIINSTWTDSQIIMIAAGTRSTGVSSNTHLCRIEQQSRGPEKYSQPEVWAEWDWSPSLREIRKGCIHKANN